MTAEEPYSRARHIEVAEASKAAMADASGAWSRASTATLLLLVPFLLVVLEAVPRWTVLLSLGAWAWPVAQAGVKVRAAHKLLDQLQRLNREAP